MEDQELSQPQVGLSEGPGTPPAPAGAAPPEAVIAPQQAPPESVPTPPPEAVAPEVDWQQQYKRLKGTMSAKDKYWAQQQQQLAQERQQVAQVREQAEQAAMAQMPEEERATYEIQRRERQWQEYAGQLEQQSRAAQWRSHLEGLTYRYAAEGVPIQQLQAATQAAQDPRQAEQMLHYAAQTYQRSEVERLKAELEAARTGQPPVPPTQPGQAPQVTQHVAAGQPVQIEERLDRLAEISKEQNKDTVLEALMALEEYGQNQ